MMIPDGTRLGIGLPPRTPWGILVVVAFFVAPWSWCGAGAAELRVLSGTHLTLVTDLPAQPEVDQLARVFDLAVPQWCAYFGVPASAAEAWHVRGYLMQVEDRFRAAGHLPSDLPPFLHGFHRGDQFWLREQPSGYYRRHLLLHEGTHAFMQQVLDRPGPGWYLEGLAELLGTHRYEDGRLTLNIVPAHRDEVPEWGRIKLIREAVRAGRPYSLGEVLQFRADQFQRVDGYAWSWAAAAFLDGHPHWQARFRSLAQTGQAPRESDRFTQETWRLLTSDPEPIEEAWQLFVQELDYGYRVAADRIHYRTAVAEGPPWTARVSAAQGWQATGISLRAGQPYRLTARGRYQINRLDPPWPCEADGVTLKYVNGMPWGILLGAVRPEEWNAAGMTPLARPVAIGRTTHWTPIHAGELFLRVNDPAGDREDNQGELEVVVEPARDTARVPN